MAAILAMVVAALVSAENHQEFPPSFEELFAAYVCLYSPQQQQRYDELATEEARIAFWNEYWREVDPTDDTTYNELLELFRRRLNDTLYFAEIGVMPSAWQEDRGRIYLLFGAPKEIRRGYLSLDAPQEVFEEVWVYSIQSDNGEEQSEIIFRGDSESSSLSLVAGVEIPRAISMFPSLPRQHSLTR